ncbi:MAG: hypothetical protein ABIJ00_08820 [Candidatus Eisenbacteria bacterium]
MKKTMSLVLLAFLTMSCFRVATVNSQESGSPGSTEQPETYRVNLIVSADDSVTAGIVREVMSSELFPGYVIVEQDYDYLIDVTAFQVQPEIGPGAGIAMSVLTLQPSTNKMLTPRAELLPDTVYTVVNHCAFQMILESDQFAGRCESADPALRQNFNLIGVGLMRGTHSSPEERED